MDDQTRSITRAWPNLRYQLSQILRPFLDQRVQFVQLHRSHVMGKSGVVRKQPPNQPGK